MCGRKFGTFVLAALLASVAAVAISFDWDLTLPADVWVREGDLLPSKPVAVGLECGHIDQDYEIVVLKRGVSSVRRVRSSLSNWLHWTGLIDAAAEEPVAYVATDDIEVAADNTRWRRYRLRGSSK